MSERNYIELALEETRDHYLALQRELLCSIDQHDFGDSGECAACGEHREGARAAS